MNKIIITAVSLISMCFARLTEKDLYKIINLDNVVAKIPLCLGTFVDEGCLLIARPGTDYVVCRERGAYGRTEDMPHEQRETFELIFERVDTLLSAQVDDIDSFAQQLFAHWNHEWNESLLSINVNQFDLNIDLTQSIFRVIAHKAIKFVIRQNKARIKLGKLENVVKINEALINRIFQFAGPDSNNCISEFKIRLQPIFDMISSTVRDDTGPVNGLADRITGAVNAYIDSIY